MKLSSKQSVVHTAKFKPLWTYMKVVWLALVPLGLQIAPSRPYSYTLGPKVRIIYIHGAPGF